jgi:pyruvate/2-oxoglutarate dehydrogenase complex dihydrolipoamide dehydrogenase (E3) component
VERISPRDVREVVKDVRTHSAFREQLDRAGVTIQEWAGTARFVDPHTIETERGLRFQAGKFILCAGGISRRLSVPGFELTATHSDAWSLSAVPPSMLVVGGGATGVQVASIFNAFGSRVELFQAGPRILQTEDEDVSAAVAAAFRAAGIILREDFGTMRLLRGHRTVCEWFSRKTVVATVPRPRWQSWQLGG